MSLDEKQYEAAIPACCSQRTMKAHMEMMLCWGLVSSLEAGESMNCFGCDLMMPGVPSPHQTKLKQMLKGHFVFRLPWRRYLSLQITRMGDAMPADWFSVAWEMLTGKRAVDPEFMARAWWYEKCERLRAHKEVWDKVRLLERKCAAQRTEIKLLTKRLRETTGEKHGRTE